MVTVVAMLVAVSQGAYATKIEKLVLYENFGGDGTSEGNITPAAWPRVGADSGQYGGWVVKGDNKMFAHGTNAGSIPLWTFGNITPKPLPGGGTDIIDGFNVDTLIARGTELPSGVGITRAAGGGWRKSVTTYYPMGSNSVAVLFYGVALFPDKYSQHSYIPDNVLPASLKRISNEKGVLAFSNAADEKKAGKDSPAFKNSGAYLYIGTLEKVTKIELMASATAADNVRTLMLEVIEVDDDGNEKPAEIYTYVVINEPRLITLPFDGPKNVQLRITNKGGGNTNTDLDWMVDKSQGGNYIAADYDFTKILRRWNVRSYDNTDKVVAAGNGLLLHMIKAYAEVDVATGYSVNMQNGATASVDGSSFNASATDLAQNSKVYIRTAATKNGKKFMGWNISGRENLSEVDNPAYISVDNNLTITPVYGGDVILLPVVDETFTNWVMEGNSKNQNGGPEYLSYNESTGRTSAKDVTVPLRYGYTSGGKDSVKISLKNCWVMPKLSLRLSNHPEADKHYGFVAFAGPHANKGYMSVESLQGIKKVDIDLSSYQPSASNGFGKTCAIRVNNSIVRDKRLYGLNPFNVSLNTASEANVQLQVGPGYAHNAEYHVSPYANYDFATHKTGDTVEFVFGSVDLRAGENQKLVTAGSAALLAFSDTVKLSGGNATPNAGMSAVHRLRMYAEVAVPDKNRYQLTIYDTVPALGKVVGTSPASGNSSNKYLEGTLVSLTCTGPIKYWSNGVVNNGVPDSVAPGDKPYVVVMNSDQIAVPVFDLSPCKVVVPSNAKATIAVSPEPREILNDSVYVYYLNQTVTVAYTPNFGYKVTKIQASGANTNSLTPTATATAFSLDVLALGTDTKVLAQVDTITTLAWLKVRNVYAPDPTVRAQTGYDTYPIDTVYPDTDSCRYGKITFSPNPSKVGVNGDTVWYPVGAHLNVTIKTEPTYGFKLGKWSDASTSTSASITMATNNIDKKTYMANWTDQTRFKLEILDTASQSYGVVEVSDKRKDDTDMEKNDWWPMAYDVELTAIPDAGYKLAGLGEGASVNFITNNVVTINMTDTITKAYPRFVEDKGTAVVLAIDENFQNGTRWPEPPGSASNVQGAIDYLGLPANFNPRDYNNNLVGLLRLLAPYRALASTGGNTISEGPGIAGKTPPTSQVLVYQQNMATNKYKIGTESDTVTLEIINFAPSNNGMIQKAVKEANVTNKYLGHVTPGFVSLKKPNVTTRDFAAGDTIGAMLIKGLAYVEKLEIGFSGGSNAAPNIFYVTTDPNEEAPKILNEDGTMAISMKELSKLTTLSGGRVTDRPDQGKYGWGCGAEGMIMDQNMYIAVTNVAETQVLITADRASGFYIHDLKVWGSPKIVTDDETGIKDLFKSNKNDIFFMLGNTNVLKIDTQEPVKAVVLYNESGVCVRVIPNVDGNTVDLSFLKAGVYGAHAYGVNGKLYTGGFIKLN